MNDSGRRMDVHITPLTENSRVLVIAADEGHKKNIMSVEGVIGVDISNYSENQYLATVDIRYDLQVVKNNIEAAILCNEPD